MLVISRLNAILAVSGLQVLHLLEEGLAGGGGLLALASMDQDDSNNGSPVKSSSSTNDATGKSHLLLLTARLLTSTLSFSGSLARPRSSIDNLWISFVTS